MTYRIVTSAQRTYVVRHTRFRSTRAHRLVNKIMVNGSPLSVYGDRLPRLTVSQEKDKDG